MLFLGVPLFFTGLTFQGLAFEKQIYFYFWLLLALVVWATKGVIAGEMKIRRTPLDIPILAFWLTYLLATIFSPGPLAQLLGIFRRSFKRPHERDSISHRLLYLIQQFQPEFIQMDSDRHHRFRNSSFNLDDAWHYGR